MTDIVEKLTQIANAVVGGPVPECLMGSSLGWVEPLSGIARDAIAEIMRLRTTLANLQAATGVGGQSFREIKDGLSRENSTSTEKP